MTKYFGLFFVALLAGCSQQEAATPAPATAPSNAVAQPTPQSFGSAAVDVITERNKIEAGLQAKAQINAAAAKENKDIDAVLNDK